MSQADPSAVDTSAVDPSAEAHPQDQRPKLQRACAGAREYFDTSDPSLFVTGPDGKRYMTRERASRLTPAEQQARKKAFWTVKRERERAEQRKKFEQVRECRQMLKMQKQGVASDQPVAEESRLPAESVESIQQFGQRMSEKRQRRRKWSEKTMEDIEWSNPTIVVDLDWTDPRLLSEAAIAQMQRGKEAERRAIEKRQRKLAARGLASDALSLADAVVAEEPAKCLMNDRQIASLVLQMSQTYGVNKKRENPLRLHFSSMRSHIGERMRELQQVHNWRAFFHEDSFMEEFGHVKERMIYLTPDSEHTLESIGEDDILIMGGIVDHNQFKVRLHTRVCVRSYACALPH